MPQGPPVSLQRFHSDGLLPADFWQTEVCGCIAGLHLTAASMIDVLGLGAYCPIVLREASRKPNSYRYHMAK